MTQPFSSRPPAPRSRRQRRPGQYPGGSRGVATLLTVMALFFLVSMVAAYASRNLVFEQRTSANQYRATQAFEAAEGGLEWALGLLNGGPLDANCVPSEDTSALSWRGRYLQINAQGNVAPASVFASGMPVFLNSGCVRGPEGWSCACPSAGPPVLPVPEGKGVNPVFRVQVSGSVTPGVFSLDSTGCTSPDEPCLRTGVANGAEAGSRVGVLLDLASALPTPPVAAVPVRGDFDVASPMRIVNTDALTNGLGLQHGGIRAGAEPLIDTVPGTPGAQGRVHDEALGNLSADRLFINTFGQSKAAFVRQPATRVIECGGGCATTLRDIVARSPGRPVWVNGDVVIDSDVQIGTPESPALIVATGSVQMPASGARIFGLVYSQAATWQVAGSGHIQGALMAEGNFNGNSAPQVSYDPAVLERLRLTTGSFVRVPGSWRDI